MHALHDHYMQYIAQMCELNKLRYATLKHVNALLFCILDAFAALPVRLRVGAILCKVVDTSAAWLVNSTFVTR
jgi:hypothetical protein